jgi:hypothetical protein
LKDKFALITISAVSLLTAIKITKGIEDYYNKKRINKKFYTGDFKYNPQYHPGYRLKFRIHVKPPTISVGDVSFKEIK